MNPILESHPFVDEFEAYDTPTSSATSFLLSLASNRTKVAFMPLLQFIHRMLSSYVTHCPILTQDLIVFRKPAAPQRFGALNMTAALGHFMMRHPDVKNSMEQFLIQHVLPEFTSSEPYMRAIVRVCLRGVRLYDIFISSVGM